MDALTKAERLSKPKYDALSIPKGIACSVLIAPSPHSSLEIYSEVKRAVSSRSKMNVLEISAKSAQRTI